MTNPSSRPGPDFGPQGPQQQSWAPQPSQGQPSQQDPRLASFGAPPVMTPQMAQQQARAAKAYAKSLRPWFKKKRFVAPILLVGAIAIGQMNNDEVETAAAGAAPSATAPTSEAPANAQAKAKAKAEAGTKPAAAKPAKTEAPALPGLGEAVSAGDWTFTVNDLECGLDQVGDDFLTKEAQGQFCLMSLKVKNNGDTAATLMSDNQKLLDKKGREYSSDSEASIYADGASDLWIEEINPGNTAKGVVVFDIPTSVKPAQASLAGGFWGIKDTALVDVS
jgi:sRNA-binding protein